MTRTILRSLLITITATSVALLVVILLSLLLPPSIARADQLLEGTHVRVIDGDTIVIGKIHVRIAGIDAPELAQECNGVKVGLMSKNYLSFMLGQQNVICNPIATDVYGRTVAQCDMNGIDIGEAMVYHGLAFSRSSVYYQIEQRARESNKPIFEYKCEDPKTFRRAHRNAK